MNLRPLPLALLLALPISAAPAGEADVLDVRVTSGADGYRFDVLVQHADTGWDHYADRFEILALDGELLGTRTLFHPHVDEQPFRRSLTGVQIPPGMNEVIVRAHDSVHEYGGAELRVALPDR